MRKEIYESVLNNELAGVTLIEQLQTIAVQRGGACLSKEYLNATTKLQWQCAKRHRWYALASTIKRGSWCKACVHDIRRMSLDEMQSLAQQHGGTCLSKRYINSFSPLRWRCCKGHIWTASASGVKAGTWCMTCYADSMRNTLQAMQSLAHAKGGRCLSEAYHNGKTKLEWECGEGHTWFAVPWSVKAGWCPTCSFERKRLGIDAMRELASKHGGSCLSEIYTNGNSPLRWQCANGHTWDAKPFHIKRGQWCQECERVAALRKLQQLAAQHGGCCVSNEYKSSRTLMTWRCLEGHEWQATPKNILRTHWCQECFRIRVAKQRAANRAKRKRRFSIPNLLLNTLA